MAQKPKFTIYPVTQRISVVWRGQVPLGTLAQHKGGLWRCINLKGVQCGVFGEESSAAAELDKLYTDADIAKMEKELRRK